MKKILALITCFISLNGWATTYYVDASGSDVTGTGAIGNPWKTVFKATNTVSGSGDIIHVNAGTYLETSQLALAPLVTLEGAGVTTVIQSTLTTQYVPLLILASAEGTNGNQSVRNIKFDGRSLTTSWGVLVSGRKNVSIYNCTVIDFMETGVIIRAKTDNNDGPPSIYATGNTFHDNIVTNCATADASFGRGCLQIGGQDGLLVYNNTIVNISRPVAQGGWPIKGNNLGYLNNCKIYNNYLERGPYPYNFNGTGNYWNFCIELFYESGAEIYGNTILGSIDMNHQSKGIYAYSVYIHDNIIGQASISAGEESGIILEYKTMYARIENNTIKNSAYGLYFTPRTTDSVTNITFKGNLLYNIGRTAGGTPSGFGWAQSSGDGTIYSRDINIDHNTFVTTPDAPNFGIRFPDGGPTHYVRFTNNIVRGFETNWGRANPSNVIDSLIIKNNDFYGNGNANAVSFVGTTPTHLDTSGNISLNPLFNVGLYTLQGGSPCINAGIDGRNMGHTGAIDTLPPTIVSVSPLNGSTGQSVFVAPSFVFNKNILSDSVNARNFTIDISGTPVSIGSFSNLSGVVILTPSSTLNYNTTYTVKAKVGVVDESGNHLASQYTYTFTTAVVVAKRRFPLFNRRH